MGSISLGVLLVEGIDVNPKTGLVEMMHMPIMRIWHS